MILWTVYSQGRKRTRILFFWNSSVLWSCLEIVVVEGGSPAVGDPLATNPLAWEENRHSSHYCSPWVRMCVEELLWNCFCCFWNVLLFPELPSNKLPGLLDSLLESTHLCLNLPRFSVKIR